MYVTGVTCRSGSSTSEISAQHLRTFSRLSMSAIEQPAARSGRITVRFPQVRMSSTSSLQFTPQNTINSPRSVVPTSELHSLFLFSFAVFFFHLLFFFFFFLFFFFFF